MIGLDTNVLVRYIMQDDKHQAALATKLIESLSDESPGFISVVSLVELCWVLETAFGLSRAQLTDVFSNLMAIEAFKIERVGVVAGAVRSYSSGKADFADYLIERSCAQVGCERTMTFDKAAAKTGGMALVQ